MDFKVKLGIITKSTYQNSDISVLSLSTFEWPFISFILYYLQVQLFS